MINRYAEAVRKDAQQIELADARDGQRLRHDITHWLAGIG